jgi:hypothetical protein
MLLGIQQVTFYGVKLGYKYIHDLSYDNFLCLHQLTNLDNNNQAFYSQASWSRLEMKPHEKKTETKQEQKRMRKTKGDKKT